MITSSTEIMRRLTRAQSILIWKGLDCIVRAFQTRTLAGQAPTSFPFGIQQLPVGFDSGTFSPTMMDRIIRLRAKLEPKIKTGGRIRMDAFEARAAVKRPDSEICDWLASLKQPVFLWTNLSKQSWSLCGPGKDNPKDPSLLATSHF
jgi:hypothetical protein